MPYIELSCTECSCYFELGIDREVDINSILCVDCASSKVNILSYETESYSRLAKVIEDVKELQKRIEVMTRDEDSKNPN